MSLPATSYQFDYDEVKTLHDIYQAGLHDHEEFVSCDLCHDSDAALSRLQYGLLHIVEHWIKDHDEPAALRQRVLVLRHALQDLLAVVDSHYCSNEDDDNELRGADAIAAARQALREGMV